MSCSLWLSNHQSAPIKNCDKFPLNENDHFLLRICEYTKPYFQVSKYLSVIIFIPYYVGSRTETRTRNSALSERRDNPFHHSTMARDGTGGNPWPPVQWWRQLWPYSPSRIGWSGWIRTNDSLINSQMFCHWTTDQLSWAYFGAPSMPVGRSQQGNQWEPAAPILVAGVGFEPTYSMLMRQVSSRTLPSDKTWCPTLEQKWKEGKGGLGINQNLFISVHTCEPTTGSIVFKLLL